MGPPRRGDLACFRYQAPDWALERHYLPEASLVCKRVLGLPGDRLLRTGNTLAVCERLACQDVGKLANVDSRGRPVKLAPLPEIIPEGSVYLGVPERPRSFDSRYLGLVPVAQLVRFIYPIWVSAREEPGLEPPDAVYKDKERQLGLDRAGANRPWCQRR
jgi:type IV secretory pathway protease TraF